MTTALADARLRARDWLFSHAAPLWASVGVLNDGCFAEKLDHGGRPLQSLNRRIRVQARQIYSFCAIGEMGWDGPWREVVGAALDRLLAMRNPQTELFPHLLAPDGSIVDGRHDLYDHAFVLFALAHAGRVAGRRDALEIAAQTYSIMEHGWLRPEGGYWEGEIEPTPPYRQNPHMHMLEAMLALSHATGDAVWRNRAEALRRLFVSRFRDSETGAVTEYFDRDWQPLDGLDGAIVEPGHCLEWAWLLDTGFADESAKQIADGLIRFARRYGVCPARGVAINEVLLDGSVHQAQARLWPQTERLKAACARHRRTGESAEAAEMVDAFNGLWRYLTEGVQVTGLWHDRMNPDGSYVAEDAPASSFYHIVCGMAEFLTD